MVGTGSGFRPMFSWAERKVAAINLCANGVRNELWGNVATDRLGSALSLERGRGRATSTAHRESYGGAGPGSRSQYCE